MKELNMPDKYKNILQDFTRVLKDIYQEELISLILYGSAVSGELVDKHSNLNLLVVLKNTDLENLKKSSRLVRKFSTVCPLFLSEEYIASSLDIFPIEFLDMRENYLLLHGKDILKDIHIDIRNLRFQCEQELKSGLLKLKQAYQRISNDAFALRKLLFLSLTSVLHISRNILRLKGKSPPYLKPEILKELNAEFKIDTAVWERILAAKAKEVKLSGKEAGRLFSDFVKELERLVNIVDKL